MHIAATGFVSDQEGSVASANALLLRRLLQTGCKVSFFSKPSFVDPRPLVSGLPGFAFHAVENHRTDALRRASSSLPLMRTLTGVLDSSAYNRLLVRTISRARRDCPFDLVLWLGDYARGRVAGVPSLSFAQGPPGTDARSILRQRREIKALAGPARAALWTMLAALRLSPLGLPPLSASDAIIVGSSVSRGILQSRYHIPPARIATLPYPIDLVLFQPASSPPRLSPSLRVLWLGRIVPRKRLDLFLDGAALAIREGADLSLTIAGGVGFIPGYENLIQAFPFPDRLVWHRSIPRRDVPALLQSHDVLAQPSDEENFGSSVAEAQACGLPVIVGRTNGNADYLCSRDIRLPDDRPSSLAAAFLDLIRRRLTGCEGDPSVSRRLAVAHFDLDNITSRLLSMMQAVARSPRHRTP